MADIGKTLTDKDYCKNIYVSIKDVGTKVFKKCAHYQNEGYTFIWTETESFLINEKEIGDCVIVPQDSNSIISLNKVT